MKNLPENEWMKGLEGRLRNYNEQPDEAVWGAIAQAIQPKREAAVWKWLDYAGSGAVALLAIFMLYNGEQNLGLVGKTAEKTENQKRTKKASATIQQSKEPSTENAVINHIGLQEKKHERVYSAQTSNGQIALANREIITNSTGGTPIVPLPEKLDNHVTLKNELTTIALDTLPNKKKSIKEDTISLATEKEEHEKAKNKAQRKLPTFYVQAAPSLSYYAVQPFSSDEVVISSFNSSSVLSSERFGFTGEVGIQQKLSKKFIYTAGLTFYQQKQTMRYQTVNTTNHQIVNSPSDPFSYTTIPQQNQQVVSYDMTNLGITTGLLYELKNAGLIHRMGLSGSYQQGFKKSNETSTYTNTKSSYAFYNVLYRVEYPINGKLTFYVQPTFTRSFYANEKLAEPFSLKLSRASIGIGLVLDF